MWRWLSLSLILFGLASGLAAQEIECCDTATLLEAVLDNTKISDGYIAPPEELEDLPAAIEAFKDGDIDAAIEIYEAIDTVAYPNPWIFYSLGLLHEANEDFEMALDYYNQAIHAHAYETAFFISRGSLYVKMDEPELAALDFTMIDIPAMRNMDMVTTSLNEEYTLDLDAAEDWLLYPLSLSGGYPGGGYNADVTNVPPHPVRLLMLEESERLVLFYLGEDSEEVLDAVVYAPDKDGVFKAYRRDYWDATQEMSLSPTEDGFSLNIQQYAFESSLHESFVLLTPDAPDFRLDFTRCEDGYVIRLEKDDKVSLLLGIQMTEFEAFNEPGSTKGRMIPLTDGLLDTFDVLEGPECIDGIAWWQMRYKEKTFWMPETDAEGVYLFSIREE